MNESILPDPPADSELARWIDEGTRLEPSRGNIVSVDAPEEPYGLRVQLDDPVRGFLIDLYHDNTRLARTVVDDRETATSVAAEMVAAAPELHELNERPRLGPERVSKVEVDDERGSPPVPEEWEDDEDEWEDMLQEAFEDAEIPRSKGSLVTKTIDGRDYYYLQWREGDTVTSKYVAPAAPS